MLLHQVRRTEDYSKGISQLQHCASILQTPIANHGFPTIWKSLPTSLKWNNSLLIVVLPTPALRLMTVAVQHIVLKETPVSPIPSNVCDGPLNEGLSKSCISFWQCTVSDALFKSGSVANPNGLLYKPTIAISIAL